MLKNHNGITELKIIHSFVADDRLIHTFTLLSIAWLVRRLRQVLHTISMDEAVEAAKTNLNTFWLVGVVEAYQGFMAVLQSLMDPLNRCALTKQPDS